MASTNKQLVQGILTIYQRHGWELQRVLIKPAASLRPDGETKALFGDAQLIETDFEAFWFARPSHQGREAWELRLLSEQPYALFEAFEADQVEEQREDTRREMEERMRKHAARRS